MIVLLDWNVIIKVYGCISGKKTGMGQKGTTCVVTEIGGQMVNRETYFQLRRMDGKEVFGEAWITVCAGGTWQFAPA